MIYLIPRQKNNQKQSIVIHNPTQTQKIISKSMTKPFDVVRVSNRSVLIKGIGRYCKCGCGARIIGRKDKEFSNATCRRRFHDHTKGPPKYRTVLDALIHLEILEKNGKKYRIITLYPKKGIRLEYPITEDCKKLWNVLNTINNIRN